MGIFLNETVANAIRHGSKRGNSSARMQGLVKRYGVRESVINNAFGYENAGFQICYESEVAWNSLNESMQLAEVKALQEGLGGFWDKIVEWGKKIIAFFVRIWQSIVAWVKKVWGKIVGVFVKTDSELFDKLNDLTTSEKVERIVYKNINFGENSSTRVSTMTSSLNTLLKDAKAHMDKANKSHAITKNTDLSKLDDSKFQKDVEKFDKEWQKANKYLDDWEKKQAVKITRNNCLDELRDFDDRMEALIDFIKEAEDFTAEGSDAGKTAIETAEARQEDAEKDEEKAKDEYDKYKIGYNDKGKEIKDEKQEAFEKRRKPAEVKYRQAQRTVKICKEVVEACRRGVTFTTSNAQKLKNIYFHNHNMCRSAASELIRLAKKKTA